jgi:coatomer subunit beta
MSTAEATCFTVVLEDASEQQPTTQELKQALEKGSDAVKLDTLRKIIIAALNGSPQVSPPRDNPCSRFLMRPL